MKKFAIATASLALLASCSSDTELTGKQEIETKANAIGFEVLNRNGIITKAGEGRAKLHESRHYNFGVFAYKNNNSDGQEIMKNYQLDLQILHKLLEKQEHGLNLRKQKLLQKNLLTKHWQKE